MQAKFDCARFVWMELAFFYLIIHMVLLKISLISPPKKACLCQTTEIAKLSAYCVFSTKFHICYSGLTISIWILPPNYVTSLTDRSRNISQASFHVLTSESSFWSSRPPYRQKEGTPNPTAGAGERDLTTISAHKALWVYYSKRIPMVLEPIHMKASD